MQYIVNRFTCTVTIIKVTNITFNKSKLTPLIFTNQVFYLIEVMMMSCRKIIEANNIFSAPPFNVGHFTLFHSHLSHNGANYQSIAEYALEEGVYMPPGGV